jgi:hypothetical protein
VAGGGVVDVSLEVDVEVGEGVGVSSWGATGPVGVAARILSRAGASLG